VIELARSESQGICGAIAPVAGAVRARLVRPRSGVNGGLMLPAIPVVILISLLTFLHYVAAQMRAPVIPLFSHSLPASRA